MSSADFGATQWREYDEAGRQIVDCGGYAYAWPHTDQPLKLGDRVVLPGNYVDPNPREATVTGFGTEFPGDLVMVLRKIRTTPGVLRPRPYQVEALESLARDWAGGFQRLAVVLPTGMGKTVIMAHLIKTETDAGKVVGVIVHREELAIQTKNKIHSIAPHLRVGVVKAERNEWHNVDVVIMSAQTLARENRLRDIPMDLFDLIIVDECHHAAAPSYMHALQWFGCYHDISEDTIVPVTEYFADRVGDTKLAGFTATMVRQDSRGLGDIFQKISYTRSILYGIRNGFLVDIKPKSVTLDSTKIDLDADVTRSGGDFTAGSLGRALQAAEAPLAMLHAITDHVPNRQGVVFWPTVSAALDFTQVCLNAGITCETISADTSTEDRQLTFKRVESGPTQVLSNVGVLTEGFDMPQLSFVGVGRPTTNEGLLTQMIGRGLRPSKHDDPTSPYPWMREPKTDCIALLLDAPTGLKLATVADLSETPVTEVRDDESLTEAIDREEREASEREKRRLDVSKLRVADIDLFGRSTSAWLQTKRGYWFIPTRDWLVVLYPEDTTGKTYMLGRVPVRNSALKGVSIGRGMTLDYAKAWAEEEATDIDPSLSSRDASWRKKRNAPPSEAQVKFADGLGIKTAGKTKVEVSDAISVVLASRRLDRYVPPAPVEVESAQ